MLAGGLFGQAPAADTLSQPRGGTLRVLILCGEGDHDWRATTPFLRRILEDTGRFDVRICETPAELSAKTLADFDVLVEHYGGPALGTDTDNVIAGFVESGKGLVVTHGAIGSRAEKHAAAPAYWPAEAGGGTDTPAGLLAVKIVRADHPIARGAAEG
jgi:hypothetical protein